MQSVEGASYDVFIVGEDEDLLDESFRDFVWRHKDDGEIWRGYYYAYLEGVEDEEPVLQDVFLFDEGRYRTDRKPSQRINVLHPNRDGVYIVEGENGQPDILVCTKRETGGGAFWARLFVIQDGELRLLHVEKKNGQFADGHMIGFDRLYYVQEGALAVPWWTNAKPDAGEYTTFYEVDVDELALWRMDTVKRK